MSIKFPQPYPEPGTFPESGDRAPGPDDKIERPSAQRMPYNLRGDFIGPPRFPTIPYKPADIEFFIAKRMWIRKTPEDAWTTPANRSVILDWLSSYVKARSDWAKVWNINERNTNDRSSTIFAKHPRLILTITDNNGRSYEVGLIMDDIDIDDDDQLRAKLDLAGTAIDNLHTAS